MREILWVIMSYQSPKLPLIIVLCVCGIFFTVLLKLSIHLSTNVFWKPTISQELLGDGGYSNVQDRQGLCYCVSHIRTVGDGKETDSKQETVNEQNIFR